MAAKKKAPAKKFKVEEVKETAPSKEVKKVDEKKDSPPKKEEVVESQKKTEKSEQPKVDISEDKPLSSFKLADIGIKFKGVTNMTEAFEIYNARGGEGGGKKKVSRTQKKRAGKISKGGGKGGGKKEPKYSRIAGTSLDDLVDQELEKLEG